ncbi:S9 family peptidase [Dokdonia ponticola]|uniref:S9 family peptidase n=1 Tax=Dokdonia ponticola TaxID=2041041 RepID=A0ABV9I3H3_9FLAO
MIKIRIVLLCMVMLSIGCKTEPTQSTSKKVIDAPVAKKIETVLKEHDTTRIDPYFWMRLSDDQKNAATPDAQTQDVLDYLNEENAYKETVLKHTEGLQEKLFDEIVGRIKKDDSSVPYTKNGYSYYDTYIEGNDYPIYYRKKEGENTQEEVLLNGPEMAKGLAYFGMGSQQVSPDNNLLAFGIDTVSRRQYTIHFKDLRTGKMLPDVLSNTTGSGAWANDNKTVFYTQKDPITLRSNKIYKHVLGTPQSEDEMVYEETDETFYCAVYTSKSGDYIMIGSFQTLSTEYRYLSADTPNGAWKVIQPREKDLEYYVEHFEDQFYMRTNHEAPNFKLVKTPIIATGKENWKDIIPHRTDVLLQGFVVFENHLALHERVNGLLALRVMKKNGEDDHYIKFNDPAYVVRPTTNVSFDTNLLRYSYSSLTTPDSTIDYNMDTKAQEVLKEGVVLDPNFSKDNYTSERLFATADDGTQIPVSIVYKKGLTLNKNTPLLLYSYGSYGSSTEPYFSSNRLSLLDRGFVYAMAHIRGGQEMGNHWYEDGKLLNKRNTFTDFINVGEFLVEKNYTSPSHLYAMGGSAGGLLMGGVINMKPALWNGVVAAVPFVDVISTMWDETIPLTTFEFDEWGNPKDKEYYDYMMSYSPYDNVAAKDYPNLLVTTGYWDSQVQYWEPAKWVAKLRDYKTDDNILVLDCDMETGHGGASGRFERYKRTALYYSFMLDLEGITE